MMYIWNMLIIIKKTTVKELQEFRFENYRGIGFTNKNSYYSMKHQKKKDLLLLVLIMLNNTINHF